MSKKLTFQEIILTLQQYWNDQGCMLMQAYDNEKGAGTMSPYTFLRAIGPEPWNAAYVEPSRRPADGRYGENPNRLYQHHQFQGTSCFFFKFFEVFKKHVLVRNFKAVF